MERQIRKSDNILSIRQRRTSVWRKVFFRLFFGVLLLLSFTLPLLSPALHYSLERILSQSGEVRAEIGFLSISVFQGEWVLKDISLWRDEHHNMSVERLALSYNFLSLMQGQPWIRSVTLTGATVPVDVREKINGKQIMVGGFRLPVAQRIDEAPLSSSDDDDSLSHLMRIIPEIRLDLIELQNIDLTLTEENILRKLEVDGFQIQGFEFAAVREVSDAVERDISGELMFSGVALEMPDLQFELAESSGRLGLTVSASDDELQLRAKDSYVDFSALELSLKQKADSEKGAEQTLDLEEAVFKFDDIRVTDNNLNHCAGHLKLDRFFIKHVDGAQDMDAKLAGLEWRFGLSRKDESAANSNGPKNHPSDSRQYAVDTTLILRGVETNQAVGSAPDNSKQNLGFSGESMDVAFRGNTDFSTILDDANLRLELAPVSLDHSIGEVAINAFAADWSGEVDIVKTLVSGSLKADIESISLLAPGHDVRFQQEKMSVDGAGLVNWSLLEQSAFRLSGDLSSLSLGQFDQKEEWLLLDNFSVKGAAVEGRQLARVDAVEVRELVSRNQGSKSPLLRLGLVDISDVSLGDDNDIAVDLVDLKNVLLNFDLALWGKEGGKSLLHPNLRSTLDAILADAVPNNNVSSQEPLSLSAQGAEKKAEPSPTNFQLKRFLLSGDNKINVRDVAMAPPVQVTVLPNRLEIKDVDTANPEQAIGVLGDIGIGEFGALDVALSIKPFLPKLGLNGTVNAKSVSLIPLSGYVSHTIGYLVQSGSLGLNSSITLEEGMIDMQNKLHLKQFYLEKGSDALAAETTKELGLPIGQALNMLRDEQDNIDLDLPITGSLSEIEVGYQDIINVALKKSLKAGVKQYLLFALQPYGALVYVGQKVGDAATKLSLKAFEFEVGASDIQQGQRAYVDKLANLLKKQSELHLRLCGVAVVEDATAWPDLKQMDAAAKKARLLELANARAVSLKESLRDRYSGAAEQVVLCAPRLGDEQQNPSVELLIN